MVGGWRSGFAAARMGATEGRAGLPLGLGRSVTVRASAAARPEADQRPVVALRGLGGVAPAGQPPQRADEAEVPDGVGDLGAVVGLEVGHEVEQVPVRRRGGAGGIRPTSVLCRPGL